MAAAPTPSAPRLALERAFQQMNLPVPALGSGSANVHSPIDGSPLAEVPWHDAPDVAARAEAAHAAFRSWRQVPAPRRGELVRRLGELLREHKSPLGQLVTLECGKLLQEGLGEVQEMIDICDFAVGLSRQLHGLTIASERPQHKMREIWQPMGPVGIISAFNFPVAVWAWNAAIALVCGNSIIWKPSEKTPCTALACQGLLERVLADFNDAPANLSQVVLGDAKAGAALVDHPALPIISATGSCAMGQAVAPRVAARFGRSILELGGNNAVIVAPSAQAELALTACVFGAVGTCGQRCTSTRRIFVHSDIYDEWVPRLCAAMAAVRIGDPLDDDTLVGPLIDAQAYAAMQSRLRELRDAGAHIHGGERQLEAVKPHAHYVRPAVVEMPDSIDNVRTETFAPIVHVFRYNSLDDAIARNNDVPQGLSSAIFTQDIGEAERFTAECGSDCGIANVNIGTSGAEIGGAFGGEKATGGGRESGSDAWKGYMRRMTSTVNYSSELPLAQGIRFEL